MQLVVVTDTHEAEEKLFTNDLLDAGLVDFFARRQSTNSME